MIKFTKLFIYFWENREMWFCQLDLSISFLDQPWWCNENALSELFNCFLRFGQTYAFLSSVISMHSENQGQKWSFIHNNNALRKCFHTVFPTEHRLNIIWNLSTWYSWKINRSDYWNYQIDMKDYKLLYTSHFIMSSASCCLFLILYHYIWTIMVFRKLEWYWRKNLSFVSNFKNLSFVSNFNVNSYI